MTYLNLYIAFKSDYPVSRVQYFFMCTEFIKYTKRWVHPYKEEHGTGSTLASEW